MIEAGVLIGGRYRVVRELSAGGMGVVWLAHHTQLDVDVAVKVISGKVTDVLLERFKREAQAAARLGGPHIVRVLDYGVHNGQPYLAMELLRGVDLATRLENQGVVEPEVAARIIRDVSRGIQLVHNAGIVHRDLKPENIFLEQVDDMEIAKVLDFGIAKDLHDTRASGSLTGDGSVGSPIYMSPQQVWGEEIDFRTDLWSLGVVAFEMLTGTNPFAADRLAKIYDLVTREPIPKASAFQPKLSPRVDAFFECALCRDPEGRFESARAFAIQFADALGLRSSLMPSSAEITLRPSLLPFARTDVTGKGRDFRSMGGATTQAVALPTPTMVTHPAVTPQKSRRTSRLLLVAPLVVAVGAGIGWLSAKNDADRGSASTELSVVAASSREKKRTPNETPGTKASAPLEGHALNDEGCVPRDPDPPCGHKLLIDDMEDNNGKICPSAGRTGYWIAFHDGTSELVPARGNLQVMSEIPGCRGKSARGVHVQGKDFRDWGAGVAAKLSENDGVLFDLSKHQGLRFWARSDLPTTVRVGVAIRGTLDATYGGSCQAQPDKVCNDHFAARRQLSTEWVNYTVRFADLKQEGWGVSTDFDLGQIAEIHFQVAKPEDEKSVDVDFWIDDLALF